MKEILLICLLVFSLSACTKPENNKPVNKPQESEKTNEVVGMVKKIDINQDDILFMEENYTTRFKFNFNNAKLVEIDLYDDSYVYAKVNVYTYIDNEWKENGSTIFDDEFYLKYLLMDFDVNLHGENHINELKFLSLDDKEEVNSAFGFKVDNQNFKEDDLMSEESFLNNEIKLYKDREVILYETTKSNGENEFSTINSLYFDEFLTHKDLGYGSGIIVTLKLSNERPKDLSPLILINDSQSLMDYINLKGVDYLDWQDFKHLKHEDVGSGMIVEIYELEDAKLKVIGKTYDEKPEKIILIKNGEDTILKE